MNIKDRIKSIIPYSHTITILLFIVYFVLMEVYSGNIDFVLDWYNASFMKDLVQIMNDPYLKDQWMTEVLPLLIILGIFVFIIILAFYFTVWRILFNDTIFNSEDQESYEGRKYWTTNGNPIYFLYDLMSAGLHWLFRMPYTKPDRSEFMLWIHQGFFPIFNPFAPPKCMVKIKGKWKDIEMEKRGLFETVIFAPPYMESTEIPNEFILTKEGYVDMPSLNRDLEFKIDDKIATLIHNTQTASYADPSIRKDQLRKSSFILPPNILEGFKSGRKKTKRTQ